MGEFDMTAAVVSVGGKIDQWNRLQEIMRIIPQLSPEFVYPGYIHIKRNGCEFDVAFERDKLVVATVNGKRSTGRLLGNIIQDSRELAEGLVDYINHTGRGVLE